MIILYSERILLIRKKVFSIDAFVHKNADITTNFTLLRVPSCPYLSQNMNNNHFFNFHTNMRAHFRHIFCSVGCVRVFEKTFRVDGIWAIKQCEKNLTFSCAAAPVAAVAAAAALFGKQITNFSKKMLLNVYGNAQILMKRSVYTRVIERFWSRRTCAMDTRSIRRKYLGENFQQEHTV